MHEQKPSGPTFGPAPETVRELARDGRLSETAATAPPEVLALLGRGAYEVAWPVVFTRLTRRLEQRRGHHMCAGSVRNLTDDCLDRFYDDVEAVVDDLLAHSRMPINNLEGWIASRLNAATVDGHRRKRGERGALQRPRVPGWLADALDDDPWLVALALEILTWVGTTATAGLGLWPIDSWADKRAAIMGDWSHADRRAAAHDVEYVLRVMRHRPRWYAAHVETPLGHKRAPVLSTLPSLPDGSIGLAPLALTSRHEIDDAQLRNLASAAVDAMASRLLAGEEATTVVPDVIFAVFDFGIGSEQLDRVPHQTRGHEESVSAILDDPTAVERIATTVLDIIGVEHGVLVG